MTSFYSYIAPHAIILIILAFAMVGFIVGKLRYDMVALLALMTGILFGIVPIERAFEGFGHPAVITVATILIITRSLHQSGIVDVLASKLTFSSHNTSLQIMLLTVVVGALSAFMNNVGALALMLPVTLQIARHTNQPASKLLMPLSFGSLLGGLITLIGTPPNIIIANYRIDVVGDPFTMFDFTPVGIVVAIAGIFYISLIGWRFLPNRTGKINPDTQVAALGKYMTEVRMPEGSPFVGQVLRTLENAAENDIIVLSIIRGKHSILAPSGFEMLHHGDVLLLEGMPDALESLIAKAELELYPGEAKIKPAQLKSSDVGLWEVVVSPGSRMEGATARSLRLHERYGINLVAIARQGRSLMDRLSRSRFRAGDVVLLQGMEDTLREIVPLLGGLPLAGRDGRKFKANRWLCLGIFGVGIALAAMGILSAAAAFLLSVLSLILFKQISLREAYESIEWPIIVLLAAMLPLGAAMSNTGAATILADHLITLTGDLPIWMLMAALMLLTMLLSDIINNAATAVLMAPIAVQLARSLEVSIDSFLMAVAVASSTTFLTPIGHQSNILVMGPGGYRFSDYARMGVLLDFVVIMTAIPAILYFWPLNV